MIEILGWGVAVAVLGILVGVLVRKTLLEIMTESNAAERKELEALREEIRELRACVADLQNQAIKHEVERRT